MTAEERQNWVIFAIVLGLVAVILVHNRARGSRALKIVDQPQLAETEVKCAERDLLERERESRELDLLERERESRERERLISEREALWARRLDASEEHVVDAKFSPDIHPRSSIIPRNYVRPATNSTVSYALSFTQAKLRAAYIDSSYYAPSAPFLLGAGCAIAIVVAYPYSGLMADCQQALGISSNEPAKAALSARLSIHALNNTAAKGPAPPASTVRGWYLEHAMDAQVILSMCPGARVHVVQAFDASLRAMTEAVQYAKTLSDVKVINMSWGMVAYPCEVSVAPNFGGQMAGVYDVPGSCASDTMFDDDSIIFTGAAGDNGSSTGWPMAHNNVVSVGGTTLSVIGSSAGTTYSETGWVGSGGGADPYYAINDTQKSYFNWKGASVPRRACPDISADADPRTGVEIFCKGYQNVPFWRKYIVGGTSLSAPIISSIICAANSIRHAASASRPKVTRSEFLSFIYNSANATKLVDVTKSGIGSDSPSYFRCGLGYDCVTGVGSPTTAFLPALAANDLP